jgi:hypothetical protein
LTPFTKDGFFQYENEKLDIFFREEDGKMFIEVIPYNGKPVRAAARMTNSGNR